MRVDNISISLDAGLGTAGRHAAQRDDKGLSAWLAKEDCTANFRVGRGTVGPERERQAACIR